MYDIQKNKYHRPLRVNEQTGELTEIQPPKFEKNKGFLSEKANRQLRKSIDLFMCLNHPNMLINNEGSENITFATFTLPSSQIKAINGNDIEYYATDLEIKKECFNPFLTELRTLKCVQLYVWRAEKQANGSIHFHVLLDRKIDYMWLRNRWNSYINKFGFVDRYSERMQKLSENDYIQMRINQTGKSKKVGKIEDFRKAYQCGLDCNWSNPNSTDIEKMDKIENVGAYVAKYMSKGEKHTKKAFLQQLSVYTNNEVSEQLYKQFTQIEGRIWQCSQAISKKRKCIVEGETELVEEIEYMSKVAKLKEVVEERFKTVIHKMKHLFIYTRGIYEIFNQHIISLLMDFDNPNSFELDNSSLAAIPICCDLPTNKNNIQQKIW